jgi:predicted enzyme related to lactoylglutathione lyase
MNFDTVLNKNRCQNDEKGETHFNFFFSKQNIMNKKTSILLLVILASACNTKPNKKYVKNLPVNTSTLEYEISILKDTTPKVTGIGGIFFRSKKPKEITKWYGENLGLSIDDFGSPFEFRNANKPDEINYLRWSPFDQETDYFDPSEKDFMINYRVQNIEGLVKKLKENGVTILDEIQEFEYGKFVHIMDPEGNKIELWEPIDSFFTKMGGETTK